jgi:glycosyltransferase involved in cell wall biosynthesis
MKDCKLTVVIIGKNEEQFIGKSIASVIEASKNMETQIIYVDSASTDKSIDEAKKFPICILQLRPDWHLSVAAGRYTGTLHARGEYIFFLDGDAEADPGWFDDAIEFMDANPNFGAVAGVLEEVYMSLDGKEVVGGNKNVRGQDLNNHMCGVKSLGGLALFRHSVLKEVGTVNPYLPTGEDDELCLRIRNAGYKLARLKFPMAIKYTEKRQSVHEVTRRCRTKMYDYGTVIRYSSLYGAGFQYAVEMIPYVVSFVLFGLILCAVIPALIYFQRFEILLGGVIIAAAYMLFKKKNLKGVVISLMVRAVSTYRTVVSFLTTKTKSEKSYPTDVIRVQWPTT